MNEMLKESIRLNVKAVRLLKEQDKLNDWLEHKLLFTIAKNRTEAGLACLMIFSISMLVAFLMVYIDLGIISYDLAFMSVLFVFLSVLFGKYLKKNTRDEYKKLKEKFKK